MRAHNILLFLGWVQFNSIPPFLSGGIYHPVDLGEKYRKGNKKNNLTRERKRRKMETPTENFGWKGKIYTKGTNKEARQMRVKLANIEGGVKIIFGGGGNMILVHYTPGLSRCKLHRNKTKFCDQYLVKHGYSSNLICFPHDINCRERWITDTWATPPPPPPAVAPSQWSADGWEGGGGNCLRFVAVWCGSCLQTVEVMRCASTALIRFNVGANFLWIQKFVKEYYVRNILVRFSVDITVAQEGR